MIFSYQYRQNSQIQQQCKSKIIYQILNQTRNQQQMDSFSSQDKESQKSFTTENNYNSQYKDEQDINQQNLPQIKFSNEKEQNEYLKLQNGILHKSLNIQQTALQETEMQLHKQKKLRIGLQISLKELRADFEKFRKNCQCNGVLDLGDRIFKHKIIGIKGPKPEQEFTRVENVLKEDTLQNKKQAALKTQEQSIFHITPDTRKNSFQKYYQINNDDQKSCTRNSNNAGWYNIISNQYLPQGQSTISFNILQIQMNHKIRIGLITENWIDMQNNNGRNVYFYFWNTNICRLNQKIKVKDADPKLKQFPCRVDVKVNKTQMRAEWIFNGKIQASCQLPQEWSGQKIYAEVYLTSKIDKIQFL